MKTPEEYADDVSAKICNDYEHSWKYSIKFILPGEIAKIIQDTKEHTWNELVSTVMKDAPCPNGWTDDWLNLLKQKLNSPSGHLFSLIETDSLMKMIEWLQSQVVWLSNEQGR